MQTFKPNAKLAKEYVVEINDNVEWCEIKQQFVKDEKVTDEWVRQQEWQRKEKKVYENVKLLETL